MRTEAAELVDDGEQRDRRGRRMTPLDRRGSQVEAFRGSGAEKRRAEKRVVLFSL